MTIRALMIGGATAVAAACPAAAADRIGILTMWKIVPAMVDPGERLVKDGEMVLRQTLLPSGLAVLGGDVGDTGRGRISARAGTQLVEASSSAGKVYCALETQRFDSKTGEQVDNRRGTTLCLLDADRNGRFEAMFEMPCGIGLAMVTGTIPKEPRSVDVAYEVRPPTEVKGDFWVAIRYEQYFNIYGNRMFFTDYGGRGEKASLTDFAKFKSKGPFPVRQIVLGATITVVGAEPDGSRIRIESSIPARPFAVFRYTTTRFIPMYR